MALDSMTGSILVKVSATAKKNLTGSDYSPISVPVNISQQQSYSSAAANAAAGGADELISFIQSIAGGASATIDLTSLTDILQATGVSLARVKGVLIRLLSVAQDTVVGTAATSVTVGKAAANQWVSQGGTSGLLDSDSGVVIKSGGWHGWGDESAGGTLADATHKDLKILNNDAIVAAKVQITILGGTS